MFNPNYSHKLQESKHTKLKTIHEFALKSPKIDF